ncbi:MAG: flippase-like domain-containing protein [Nitrososphaerota archaeon]|nr:flippase-like domain-containing protein [Nitrososphaerota archaeon]
MRRSYVRFVPAAGIALSLGILAAVASQFNFDSVLRIDPLYLFLAFLSSVLLLVVQGLRFKYVIDSFSGNGRFPTGESMLVRMGSQFVAMTTPGYVGGEVARAAWLTRRGVDGGRALWLPYIEIIFDVISSNMVAFAGGAYAIATGNYLIGGVLVSLSVMILAFILLVVRFSRKEDIRVPGLVIGLSRRALGEKRSSWLVERGDRFLAEFRNASRVSLSWKNARQLLWISAYTAVMVVLTGACLFFVTAGLSLKLGLPAALFIVFVSIVLGNIPVTLGGSGMVEVSVYYYTSLVFGVASWPMVFAWRIASYILPLFITGGAANVALHKYAR